MNPPRNLWVGVVVASVYLVAVLGFIVAVWKWG
jgi:hypothetical protein